MATNTRTGKTSPEPATAVMVKRDTDRYNLTIRADGKGAVIGTTRNHLFWDVTTNKWTKAEALKQGDHLRTPRGVTAMVLGGKAPKDPVGWMWDISVPGGNDHDFYIDTAIATVLVHNCPDFLPEGYKPDITERGLAHSFGSHAREWFGGEPTHTANMEEWKSLIERAAGSSKVIPWSSGSTRTYAYLARIGGKWFAAQFDRTTGELVTAFRPNNGQVGAMLRLLGK